MAITDLKNQQTFGSLTLFSISLSLSLSPSFLCLWLELEEEEGDTEPRCFISSFRLFSCIKMAMKKEKEKHEKEREKRERERLKEKGRERDREKRAIISYPASFSFFCSTKKIGNIILWVSNVHWQMTINKYPLFWLQLWERSSNRGRVKARDIKEQYCMRREINYREIRTVSQTVITVSGKERVQRRNSLLE